MYQNSTAGPPESTAETIPRLKFLPKSDRVNGTPLAEVDEENNCHGIYPARVPVVSSMAEASTVVLFKFTAKHGKGAHRLLANIK